MRLQIFDLNAEVCFELVTSLDERNVIASKNVSMT